MLEPAPRLSSHTTAVLQALLVTFLWSTSWVLIKFGLQDIPALTFAGLRYGLAFLCLLPFALRREARLHLHRLAHGDWLRLIVLGLLYYTFTQGAQFVSLAYLPAVTVSLLLNFTSPLVALLGIMLLAEIPTRLQWSGVALYLAGILLYFYPVNIPGGQIFGLLVACLGVLSNALSSILGRAVNRSGALPPLLVTVVSMGMGALAMLAGGLLWQGMPALELRHWAIIVWLAVVNTALAFPLWNHTLRTLSAMESTVINSTMLIQIAILAWIFLGERLGARELVGMGLAGLGALLVQLRRRGQT